MKLFVLLFVMILLVGCSKSEQNEEVEVKPSKQEKIITMLESIENYEAEVIVTYFSNKNINKYQMLQQVKKGVGYRIVVTTPESVAGNITISDASGVVQINTRLNLRFEQAAGQNEERSSIILTNFAEEFLSSSEQQIENMGNITILTIDRVHTNPYMANFALWLDSETLTPLRLNTYDIEGELRIEVIYQNIAINIDDTNWGLQS